MTFSGFNEGKISSTSVPNPFFHQLLPLIDHLGELKITLYAFWALARKEGPFQYLRKQTMIGDELLLESLASSNITEEEALNEALERAVNRGTLIKVSVDYKSDQEDFYFLNTPKGRAAVKGLKDGEWQPSGEIEVPIKLAVERPNIFNLYEKNIGPLTPMIAETLRDAEQDYPLPWIEDAMRIAIENNVRKWRYIEAILEDWQRRGRDVREDRVDTEKARRRYLEGDLGD